TIQFHPGPRVASIVLNRPPLNIINLEMLDELNAAWSEVEDLKAQVAVFSAAGDHAFSAGVDVADHMPGKIEGMIEKFHHLIRRIRKSDCVTIAATESVTLNFSDRDAVGLPHPANQVRKLLDHAFDFSWPVIRERHA